MIKVKNEYLKIWNDVKKNFDQNLLDESKLNRQLEAFTKWHLSGCRSAIEAVTGFGKTVILIIAIIKLNKSLPNGEINIVVPTKSLKEDWLDKEQGHIVNFNLKNVEVFVINSYTMKSDYRNCILLGIDELHRATNEDSEYFSTVIERTKFKYLLGLSATLESKDKRFLEKYNISIADSISLKEAQANNWISNFIIYNIGCDLSEEDTEKKLQYDTMLDNYYKKFNYDFNLAMACSMGNAKKYTNNKTKITKTGKSWRLNYAYKMGWQPFNGDNHSYSPKNIYKYAGIWSATMRNRAEFLHNARNKILLAYKIIKKLDKKTILFSEYTEPCNIIEKNLSNSKACHSNIPTVIFKDKSLQNEIAVAVKINNKTKYKLLENNKVFDTYKEIKEFYPESIRYSSDRLKSKIKKEFEESKFKYLLTAKAFNEGFDCRDIELGVILSGNSTKVANIQRMGRVIRIADDKFAIIVNIYVKDTQDEKWLVSRQKGTPKSKINWIDNIDQIVIPKEIEDIQI